MARAPRASAWSIAIWVGQIGQQALLGVPGGAGRVGDPDDHPGTLKRRWAICAITRLVLSPLVAATNTSACSIPASISASTSSAVPTVNRPPASSQRRRLILVEPLVRERVAVEHRHLVPRVERPLGHGGPDAT